MLGIKKYKYDEAGNRIEEISEQGVKYQYRYDEVGNWLSKTEIGKNKSKEITIREIEYYK